MALNLSDCMQKIRGSVTGLAPFDAGSLGKYLQDNWGEPNGNKAWGITFDGANVYEIARETIPDFLIAIVPTSVTPIVQVGAEQTTFAVQRWTFRVIKRLAKKNAYAEDEELPLYDLRQQIIDWVTQSNFSIGSLTLDAGGLPTLTTFTYISEGNVERSKDGRFIRKELYFTSKIWLC